MFVANRGPILSGGMSLLRCLSSLGCPGFSLEETLALAAAHGIPAVELRTLGDTMELSDHLAATYGTPAELAARVKSSRVRIVALNASLHLVGATAAERGQLVAFVPWADALGARWLRVFDGGQTAGAAEIAEAAETVRWWRELRGQHGWRADIMVETHDSLFTTAAIGRFRAAVPDAAILWDAHHTWRKGGEDPVATWRAIGAGVVHVHVKDSIGVPSARHPFTYVLPGDGGFPIAPLLAALRKDGFSGPVSLEWEKRWHPYLPPLADALRVAAERGWW